MAVGKRSSVHRETTVWVDLLDGEVDDLKKKYGQSVFAPRQVRITYLSTNGDTWSFATLQVRGPQRLKSGGVSAERWHDSYWWRLDDSAPAWAADLVTAQMPGPVADGDLPIIGSDLTELDGGAS